MSHEEAKMMFSEALIRTVISAINRVYNLEIDPILYPHYYEYPESFYQFLLDDTECREYVDGIPLKYGIHYYIETHGERPIDYSELISANITDRRVECQSLDGYTELIHFLSTDLKTSHFFGSDASSFRYNVARYIGNIVNRYLYITHNFHKSQINKDILIQLVAFQANRVFEDRLEVDYCIPISLLIFEEDNILISDDITISKMSDQFQVSRFHVAHFATPFENQFTQCASFMLRIKGFTIDNTKLSASAKELEDYRLYPRVLIDDFFAVLRIVGCDITGYGQLLISPDKWADKWVADLPAVYGTVVVSFCRNDMFRYNDAPIHTVSKQTIEIATKLFGVVRGHRGIAEKLTGKEKKTYPFRRVFQAMNCLNRCLLREANDDTLLDAVIGIEALLSENAGELTYKISSRISALVSQLNDCPYTPSTARKAMKRIYALRSDIAHGRGIEENKPIIIAGQEKNYQQVAIELLRYSLLFIIQNEEYLVDGIFESMIDNTLQKDVGHTS